MSDGLDYIAAVLQHGAVSALREVERGHFLGEEEQRTFDYIHDFTRRHRTLPQMDTVATDCNVEMEEMDEPVSYYRERIYARKIYTEAREGFGALRQALSTANSDEIVEAVRVLNRAVYQSSITTDLQEIDSADAQMRSRLSSRSNNIMNPEGVITGWPTLDEDTGGYQNGDLIGWIARPGLGKTYLLLYQALNAWISGRSVLFVSMEMPIHAITHRLASLRSNVDARVIRRNRLSNEALIRLYDGLEARQGVQPFHIYSGNFGRSTTDISTLMTELRPDVVFVDGIYLLVPATAPRNADRFQRVAFVLDEMKSMTLEHDRPILYTLQFNREGAKHSSLETIGYTDAASQHSSLVYAIEPWRRHRENRINTQREEDVRVIRTIKGREGESVLFPINYQFRPINFDESSDIYIGRPPDEVLAQSAMENTNYMLPRRR